MISVIIPTLNKENAIGEILSQFSDPLIKKYNVELILSDGGSSDQTLKLAKQKAHVVLVHEGNRRQTIAEGRNAGARQSGGDVLFFLNADVRVERMEWYIKAMLQALREPKVVAVTCPVFVYPEEENSLDKVYHRVHNFLIWLVNHLGIGMGRGECHVVRRSAFFRVGGYDGCLAAGEDFDLYMKLARKGKIRFVWSVKVFESPRRYRKLGYARVTLSWFLNALSIMFFRKSFSKEWEPVR